MTKKVNTGGAVNTLATALQNAGVAASDIVVTSAPAAVDAQQQQQQQQQPAPAAVDAQQQQQQQQQQPAPASPQAAIEAAQSLEEEIAAAAAVWQHAKATGISKDKFLTFCQIDPEKFAFYMTHKKAIFGSKKQQLEEAAQNVIDANRTVSNGKKSKKAKKNVAKPPIEKRALKTSRLINKTIAETIGLRLI
jgi:hypothetical protein